MLIIFDENGGPIILRSGYELLENGIRLQKSGTILCYPQILDYVVGNIAYVRINRATGEITPILPILSTPKWVGNAETAYLANMQTQIDSVADAIATLHSVGTNVTEKLLDEYAALQSHPGDAEPRIVHYTNIPPATAQFHLTGSVDGHTLRGFVDSGTNITVMRQKPSKAQKIGMVDVSTIDGNNSVDLYSIAFELDGKKLTNVEAIVSDELNYDFLVPTEIAERAGIRYNRIGGNS